MEKELIVLTGVSGAGKSSAMGFLEDAGYYCIDNMPPKLMATFVSLLSGGDEYGKVAIVCDVRSSSVFKSLLESIDRVVQYGYSVKIIYLDVDNHEVLKRYKLTRRKHPLADKFNGSIRDSVAYEKKILAPLRERADYVIDTTGLETPQLKTRLGRILFSKGANAMSIHCMSFGFKHGVPSEADFVVDVRCLPNPYWIDGLRNKTGLDAEVRDYVFSFEEAKILLEKLIDLLDFLCPLYVNEGKSQAVFAIGCTGGKHRSVAFAEALKAHFEKKCDNVFVQHRDIEKN